MSADKTMIGSDPDTSQVAVRLSPELGDLFIHTADTPRNLGHALHRASERDGKLAVRVTRQELDAMIARGIAAELVGSGVTQTFLSVPQAKPPAGLPAPPRRAEI